MHRLAPLAALLPALLGPPAARAAPPPAPAKPAAKPAATPAAPPAAPAPAPAATGAPDPGPRLDWTLSVVGGGFSGQGTRTDQGGVAAATLQGDAEWLRGNLRLAVPFLVGHQQTFGASLSETVGAVGVEPTWRLQSGTRLGLEASLRGTWRPDWPDQYQRTAAGDLPPTDRYTNVVVQVGAHGWWRPGDGQHLRARYRFLARRYVQDPNFDPTVPTHLTPSNVNVHELSGSWRRLGERVAWSVRLDASLTDYLILPARDATTASTTGNPLQRLVDLVPRVEVELFRDRAAEVQLSYAFHVQQDTWEGYYSYGAHRPEVSVLWKASPRLTVQGRVAAQLLQYGPDAKSGASPTPTEDGEVRWDDKLWLGGQVRYRLRPHLSVIGEAEWISRSTNYPDYVPGVYPASRFYDIDFDYDNLRAVVGVEWRG